MHFPIVWDCGALEPFYGNHLFDTVLRSCGPDVTMVVVMRIECPECAMAFNVPDGAIKAKGRKLRCSRCEHQWIQYPTLTEQKPQKKESVSEPFVAAKSDEDPTKEAGDTNVPGDRPADEEAFGAFDAPPIGRRFLLDRTTQKLRRPAILNIAAVLVLVIVFPLGLILSRASLVSVMPGFSPLFDAIGLHVPVVGEYLVIQNVGVWRKVEGDVEVMLIEGEIHNDSDNMQSVPIVRGTIEDAEGNPLQSAPYAAEAAILIPGDTVTFQYEIPRPNPLAARVTITFSDERPQSDFGY